MDLPHNVRCIIYAMSAESDKIYKIQYLRSIITRTDRPMPGLPAIMNLSKRIRTESFPCFILSNTFDVSDTSREEYVERVAERRSAPKPKTRPSRRDLEPVLKHVEAYTKVYHFRFDLLSSLRRVMVRVIRYDNLTFGEGFSLLRRLPGLQQLVVHLSTQPGKYLARPAPKDHAYPNLQRDLMEFLLTRPMSSIIVRVKIQTKMGKCWSIFWDDCFCIKNLRDMAREKGFQGTIQTEEEVAPSTKRWNIGYHHGVQPLRRHHVHD